jgi:hypothetical protein
VIRVLDPSLVCTARSVQPARPPSPRPVATSTRPSPDGAPDIGVTVPGCCTLLLADASGAASHIGKRPLISGGPHETLFQPDNLGKSTQGLPKATPEAETNTVRSRRRTTNRLSDRQVAALVDGYLAGATAYELADRFGIHRVTVSAHLHRQGVVLRRQGLDTESTAQALRLYQDEWSVARIGERLGVEGGTVWTALKAEGVRMRDAHGRER